MSADRIGLLVVEDQKTTREMVVDHLEAYTDGNGRHRYTVVAQAETAEEATSLIVNHDVDFSVAVLDLALSHPDHYPHGFELAELVHNQRPDVRIVLWSAWMSVEGDLLRRASQPFGDRFLVDAIVSKEHSLLDLMEAINTVCTMPSVYLWVDPRLRPPRSYSAVLDLTQAEDEWLRDFAQNPGGRPRDAMDRLGIKSGAYYERRDKTKLKVVKELTTRRSPLLRSTPVAGAKSDNLLPDSVLWEWAHQRYLDWPLTRREKVARAEARNPNEGGALGGSSGG
ncbi:MAG: hypothetical protein AB1673_12185 [Actinomycetota bacterium]